MSRIGPRPNRLEREATRYFFLSRSGGVAVTVGATLAGETDLAADCACFGFFASLLPRRPLDILVSLIRMAT